MEIARFDSGNRNDPGEFLLACLSEAESRESRRTILEKLMPLLPFGHHPLLQIEQHPDAMVRHRLRQHHVQYLNEIKLRLDVRRLIRGGIEIDLEQGAFLVSRLSGDPYWTPERFRQSLDALALPLQERYIQEKEPLEQLDLFLDYVFREQKLAGNQANYYDPRNSYLTEVIRTKTGIPVALGTLCVLIARRIALNLQGVNLPGHFMLVFKQEQTEIFMDPFHQGQRLDRQDCLGFLEKQYIPPANEYLQPASNLDILKRMYRNLIAYSVHQGDQNQEKILRQHFAILEDGQ
ncbi:MAG: transglutaminase family protein [Leptospiraceae bacterium]|nr:transglutaminase family protein [Leptospiraceae bacterium]